MFKKLVNKIIMNTECYLKLRNRLEEVEEENTYFKSYFGIESIVNKDTKEKIYRSTMLCKITRELEDTISKNKTTARKIIRAVNSLLKKNEIVNTQKEIKRLCNEIIKGE